jgi:hypothetical protein
VTEHIARLNVRNPGGNPRGVRTENLGPGCRDLKRFLQPL